jgi:hypothetical protein
MSQQVAAVEVLEVLRTMKGNDDHSQRWIEQNGLGVAIRLVASRHGIRFQEVESALDGALAFRRA